ncbi:hypothetical protein V6N13_062672 [Hibiscus sabdariffa]|uniref:Plant thionin family protein n=1 Tax=Hibiscus sabdariffa TaxID=183260 RepID=A0ABR2BB51_9ROSI
MASKRNVTILVILAIISMVEMCSSKELAGCMKNCMPVCMEDKGAVKTRCSHDCKKKCKETKGKKEELTLIGSSPD